MNLHDDLKAEFFVLRTPLLPFDELLAWGAGTVTAQQVETGAEADCIDSAWRADVELLRSRLRRLIERPEIIHALFVATPSLESGLEYWKRDPASKKGLQAERALVRYFERMSARPTPFGLFSGCSVGRISVDLQDVTALDLASMHQYRLCCRLDFDYLFALTIRLQSDPGFARSLVYTPNSSLHRLAGFWHYIESKSDGSRRTYHLVRIADDEFLSAALRRAQGGASIPVLTAAVVAASADEDLSAAEAEQFVLELASNGVLVSTFTPLVTGTPPLDDLIGQIASVPGFSETAATLEWARDKMGSLDRKALTASPKDYREISSGLERLPAKFDLSHLFQVDMTKPMQKALLTQTVLTEIVTGLDVVCRLGQTSDPEALRRFRDAFTTRYERAQVPLLEALDEECGIGFGEPAADSAALIKGLRFGITAASTGRQDFQSLLQRRLYAAGKGQLTLSLDASDLPPADVARMERSLPDSFALSVSLAANSMASLHEGKFSVRWRSGSGPDGARLLGRFCHTDETLAVLVRNHVRLEETHNPNAVYAEIVYLPEGRIGNVLCRPVLRDYEIVYLGRSGAPPDRQIPVSELLVFVENGAIVLYSPRLARRVIPRLTNAHGFMNPGLSPVYRFLCHLQHQHGVAVADFSWGALSTLDFLPRLCVGRNVLDVARWRITKEEIAKLSKPTGSRQFVAVQTLRREKRWPRWVNLEESDNSLPVDLDNPLSVEAFVHTLKRGSQATIKEMYPSPDELCVTGPEGRFSHEINIPFVRRTRSPEGPQPARSARVAYPAKGTDWRQDRCFAPGSEWLYVKLYGGSALLDEIMTTVMAPLADEMISSGAVSHWFFLRYSDPQWHLRVRFTGEPARLTRELLPRLSELVAPLLRSGSIWKMQFDTYEREMERYGGRDGMLASEEIFFADSVAVTHLLASCADVPAYSARWRAGLIGMDRLMSDFGLDLDGKRTGMRLSRDGMLAEFQGGTQLKKDLGDRFRAQRKDLESLLKPEVVTAGTEPARRAFETRSAKLREPVHRLQTLAETGKLTVALPTLIASYLHMHLNRLLRSSARTHELVLYDFLFRLYDGMSARRGHAPVSDS